jgi:hypothetical protein
MSATNAPTLRKLAERMTLRVISPKKRSTRSHYWDSQATSKVGKTSPRAQSARSALE